MSDVYNFQAPIDDLEVSDDGFVRWTELANAGDAMERDMKRRIHEAAEAERGRIRQECRSDLLEAMRDSWAYDDIEYATAPWAAGERITTPTGDDDE